MIKFLKKYIILIILVILVIILVFLKIFYGNTDKTSYKNSVSVVTTPTEIPTPTSFETESEDVDRSSNYDSVLPFIGKKMEIAGIKSPGILEIMIENETDKNDAIKEVELWKVKYPTFKDYTLDFKIHKLN